MGLSPAGVEILTQQGHQVYVEHEAGVGAGFDDREFETAGARLVYSPEEVFVRADLLLKVARPTRAELDWLRPGTTVTGLLHLASSREDKIEVLLEKKITSIAYEQIETADGSLPVLRPFSQIGGRMSASIAARLLQNNWGGKGNPAGWHSRRSTCRGRDPGRRRGWDVCNRCISGPGCACDRDR